MIKDKKIYAKNRVPLPTPEFYVFYNGEEPYLDKATLKLSDAFEKLSALLMVPVFVLSGAWLRRKPVPGSRQLRFIQMEPGTGLRPEPGTIWS